MMSESPVYPKMGCYKFCKFGPESQPSLGGVEQIYLEISAKKAGSVQILSDKCRVSLSFRSFEFSVEELQMCPREPRHSKGMLGITLLTACQSLFHPPSLIVLTIQKINILLILIFSELEYTFSD